MRFDRALRLAAVTLLAPALMAQGGVDPDFVPAAYPDCQAPAGFVVGFDETDGAWGRITGRFGAVADVLACDGYEVQAFDTPFDETETACLDLDPPHCSYYQALLAIDLLVIGNARPGWRPPVSEAHAHAIARWVGEAGGRLFLVADHDPWPGKIQALAEALALDWPSLFEDWAPLQSEFRIFSLAPPVDPFLDGSLDPRHVIARGRSAAEEVLTVQTFYGSGLRREPGEPGNLLLAFPPGAQLTTADGLTKYPADGYGQGLAFDFGAGRVYASAEFTMFTATVDASGEKGMNAHPSNEQYLLNVVHWLEGLLPDADADGLTDARDNCTLAPNGRPVAPGEPEDQRDTDADGFGNACDPDFDGDGIVGASDFIDLSQAYGSAEGDAGYDPDVDLDGDGAVGDADWQIFQAAFGSPPGPSGLACAGTVPCP